MSHPRKTPVPTSPKPATALTAHINSLVEVPAVDADQEAVFARRGQLRPLPPDFTISRPVGPIPVWSLAPYSEFLHGPAPDSVNPSLWRNALLNMHSGLFEVVPDAVYQVRCMDLSDISFLEDPTGASQDIVVVDPLVSEETAAAALKLYRDERGSDRRIAAVIYTHSHTDHYGGVRGLFPGGVPAPEDHVEIVAPEGFLQHAVSENVYAGNAMSRRATYMYGSLLARGTRGQVDGGLGKTLSNGRVGLLAPTRDIGPADCLPGTVVKLGPVRFEFQLTPGTEAPAEMNFYLPDIATLCMAENANASLHNLYSPRGAQVRDGKAWSIYLNEAADLFGARAKVMFASHFWPRWVSPEQPDAITSFLTSQADLYRWLNDEALRLSNQGFTMLEVAERLDDEMPAGLRDKWYNRGYYGTVNNNAKAVYQRYLGWFDGNAAHLHTLPPEQAGARYVAAMGGAAKVREMAAAQFADAKDPADYRWVAEMISHLVFADPSDKAARHIEADVLEQLGYQSESAVWRNFYLAGARELRDRPLLGGDDGLGVNIPAPETITEDTLAAMPLAMLFDYLGIRLNSVKEADRPRIFGFTVTDGVPGDTEACTIELRNSVQLFRPVLMTDRVQASYTIARSALNNFALAKPGYSPAEMLARGELVIRHGTLEPFELYADSLEVFDFWFPVTTP
ncbi:MBL fold metallo-hydrolase [Catenulispora sp. NF23]|uniref:alkyl/aryl-sulfatase n=1 Tax=Catenulispora pinistramenti TaxID=2705254 RepID=UPI001BA918EF|nr:alkyl sulfatase dimerization domain-containing protein [Catenulispora pinistramenti]MBS2534228.1 MBL fold metallo-hydrolase [Catenulispora pinistramenti]